jgi:hypothetical protein
MNKLLRVFRLVTSALHLALLFFLPYHPAYSPYPLGGRVWEFEYKDELLKSKICPNQHLDRSEYLRQ